MKKHENKQKWAHRSSTSNITQTSELIELRTLPETWVLEGSAQYLCYSQDCTPLDRDPGCCSWNLLEQLPQLGGQCTEFSNYYWDHCCVHLLHQGSATKIAGGLLQWSLIIGQWALIIQQGKMINKLTSQPIFQSVGQFQSLCKSTVYKIGETCDQLSLKK